MSDAHIRLHITAALGARLAQATKPGPILLGAARGPLAGLIEVAVRRAAESALRDDTRPAHVTEEPRP